MKRRPVVSKRREGLVDDPHWYKDAVIYELRVRSFADAKGDGIGDFQGLTSKLPYLEDLGVTAVWLLPICPSPLRDDGYDIADYTDVHPDIGTLDDFRVFLDEAHRRGIRVITELVLNHTSDQHPWFKQARRAPKGSVARDFYVWSDSPDRYPEARIIFKDFELSNWTWDPVAHQYFWHRFYAHQPDLNFESPAVQEALLGVVDFWFELGVDGMRLDAVPYLFEEEGTNCENLPKTHAFLRRLRSHVDARFRNRMLLAEANQWPEHAATYFGNGDECHMNFHFPIMPRIFMSIHMEDRLPLLDIVAQTPQLADGCQWALFLRNHDELTLEMVTDEERDYMYRAFAGDPTARINLGIRRRLAPLLGNDRRNIELMNGLLFSLPGTPVIYYGDEIGMGDNIYLGDRQGVRTPMQWSADRNAGFSRANPQRLILPIIIDPEYHFESLNVEAQQNNPNSLLWWTKRLIALRKRFQAFGRGSIEFLTPDNPRVLAFLRKHGDEQVLVVANLSRHIQHVELDLSKLRGLELVELFGGSHFPEIKADPYPLTLAGHGFFWFALERPAAAADVAREAAYSPPPLVLRLPGATRTAPEDRSALERLLPDFLTGRRWFTGGHELRGIQVVETFALGGTAGPIDLLIIRADFADGPPALYLIALAVEYGERAAEIRRAAPHAVVANLRHDGESDTGVLFDALQEASRAPALLDVMRRHERLKGRAGELIATAFAPIETTHVDPRPLRGEHRFASLAFGDQYVLKLFRRLQEGMGPELETGRFLASQPRPAPIPRLIGALEYRPRNGEATALATLSALVPAAVTAEEFAREELSRFFERVLTTRREEPAPPPPQLWENAALGVPPPAVAEVLAAWPDAMRLLGRRTAELHVALAATDDPAFAPEPYSVFDQRSVYQTNRNLVGRVLRLLRTHAKALPSPASALARDLLAREHAIYHRLEPLRDRRFTGQRARYHGDLRLRKVLYSGRDFLLVGFEGDTDRPLPERRRKRSPLRDVAGLIRSISEVASLTVVDDAVVREADRALVEPWTRLWVGWSSAAILAGYLEGADGATFLPRGPGELVRLVDGFIFEKALATLGRRLLSGSEPVDRTLRFLLEQLDVGPG